MACFKEMFEQKLEESLMLRNDNAVIPRKEKRAKWIAQLIRINEEGLKQAMTII